MGYEKFTEAETDALAPHRQALWKKAKGNDDDHKARLDGLVGLNASALIDHFEHTDPAIDFSVMAPHTSRWATAVSGAGATVTISPGTHIVILKTTPTDKEARLRGNYRVQPTLLPLIRLRCKVSPFARIAEAVWGFQTDRALATVLGGDAVALYRLFTNSGLKFIVRKDGAQTTGATDITLPTDGAWFSMEIKYTDNDTVECRFDAAGGEPSLGSLIETFNGPGENVPSAAGDEMFPEIHALHDAPAGDLNASADWIAARNTFIEDEA